MKDVFLYTLFTYNLLVIIMRLSDLQNKDVIDVQTGNKIGSVIDAEIKKENGLIIKLIVYERRGILDVFKLNDEIEIPWDKIKKIGTDVILVSKN